MATSPSPSIPSRSPSRPADSDTPNIDTNKPYRTYGVFSSLKPTHAEYHLGGQSNDESSSSSAPSFFWRSRDHRKGRHTLLVAQSGPGLGGPSKTATLRNTLATTSRLFTTFPYWDISWVVAVLFVIGSTVWVINGFFVFLPLVRPETEFGTEVIVGGGVTAFIGATIFIIGSWGYVLEVINEDESMCFGWAVRDVKGKVEDGLVGRLMPCPEDCRHRFHIFGRGRSNQNLGTDLLSNPDFV